jgi:hypothetical protein
VNANTKSTIAPENWISFVLRERDAQCVPAQQGTDELNVPDDEWHNNTILCPAHQAAHVSLVGNQKIAVHSPNATWKSTSTEVVLRSQSLQTFLTISVPRILTYELRRCSAPVQQPAEVGIQTFPCARSKCDRFGHGNQQGCHQFLTMSVSSRYAIKRCKS